MKRIFASLLAIMLIAGTALAAFAASTNFVPSIGQKDYPILISAEYQPKEGQNVDVTESTVLTPYSQKDTADNDIKAALETAYNELAALDNVGKINTKADLDAAAKAIDPEYTASDLVISDMFDVTLKGTYGEQLPEEGNNLLITLLTPYGDNASKPIVLCRDPQNGEWVMVDSAKVVKLENGKYSIVLDNSYPVIFLKPASEAGVKPSQTGDNVNTILWISLAAVSCIGIAIILPVMLKKKEN